MLDQPLGKINPFATKDRTSVKIVLVLNFRNTLFDQQSVGGGANKQTDIADFRLNRPRGGCNDERKKLYLSNMFYHAVLNS